MEQPGFRYANLLGREYDDTVAVVRGVTYITGYFGSCDRTYHFPAPVSERAAISRVEAALSKPVRLRYYTSICGDLLVVPHTWEEVVRTYPTRGHCLRASVLRRAVLGEDGYLTLLCDS